MKNTIDNAKSEPQGNKVSLRIEGMSRPGIVREMLERCPDVLARLDRVRRDIPRYKREIDWYQATVLYTLASQYNNSNKTLLEIGTAYGYSAAITATAAPGTDIVTLNPKEWEADRATEYLKDYGNVVVIKQKSWDYLEQYGGPQLDWVFIDGDHGKVAWDFGWWRWLKPRGLMLFHDYAPQGSNRPCQPVFEAVETLRKGLGRPYDVLVTDTTGVGLAGFYRNETEDLPALDVESLLWGWNSEDGWYKLSEGR